MNMCSQQSFDTQPIRPDSLSLGVGGAGRGKTLSRNPPYSGKTLAHLLKEQLLERRTPYIVLPLYKVSTSPHLL